MDTAAFPSLSTPPSGIAEHQVVQGRGLAGLSEALPEGTPVRGTGLPLEYRILPESDLNGAGLLYFARYVAIANYGVRRFLAEQLARPVSGPLIECLATERLSTYYFQNADAFDSVRIFVTAWLDPAPPAAPTLDANACRSVARFQFHVDLYRVSDGVLMASCRSGKVLNVPDREKGLVYECERLLPQLREAPSGGAAPR
jgi:probable biosynthetic protein (TIGR04098 family)